MFKLYLYVFIPAVISLFSCPHTLFKMGRVSHYAHSVPDKVGLRGSPTPEGMGFLLDPQLSHIGKCFSQRKLEAVAHKKHVYSLWELE